MWEELEGCSDRAGLLERRMVKLIDLYFGEDRLSGLRLLKQESLLAHFGITLNRSNLCKEWHSLVLFYIRSWYRVNAHLESNIFDRGLEAGA